MAQSTTESEIAPHLGGAPHVEADAEPRCFVLDLEAIPLGGNRVLVRSTRRGVARVLPAAEAQLLMTCREPRPVASHAARIHRHLTSSQARASAPESDRIPPLPFIEQRLQQLVAEGILTTDQQVGDSLRSAAAEWPERPARTICAVCFPTRDRPAMLARALRSYAENDLRYDRCSEFVVLDDSRSADSAQENRANMRAVREDADRVLRYAGLAERETYAQKLAEYSGVPLDIVRFLLTGDPGVAHNIGAARTALLLDTIGETYLQVDDDTTATVFRPPVVNGGIGLSSQPNCYDWWYYHTRQQALDAADHVQLDPLALHESVLGQRPAVLAARSAEGIHLDQMVQASCVTGMHDPNANVAVSYLGLVGDCGGPGLPQSRLFAFGATYERLRNSETVLDAAYHSRQVIACTTRLLLNDLDYCVTAHMATDNRGLLPPYMPCQSGEDTLFGIMRVAIDPLGYSAKLPYGILHDPVFRQASARLIPFEVSAPAIICLMASRCIEFWPRCSGEAVFETFGLLFRDLGALSAAGFEQYVNEAVTAVLSRRLRAMEANRQMDWLDASDAFHRRANEHADELSAMIARGGFHAPPDLPGTTEERRSRLQSLIARYGAALLRWPELLRAAGELRSAGTRLSQRV